MVKKQDATHRALMEEYRELIEKRHGFNAERERQISENKIKRVLEWAAKASSEQLRFEIKSEKRLDNEFTRCNFTRATREGLIDLLVSLPSACWVDLPGLNNLIEEGSVQPKAGWQMDEIIERLIFLFLNAYATDESERSESVEQQVKAIHKLVFPERYDLPTSVINEVANKYDLNPHLARAFELLDVMDKLRWFVAPARKGVSVYKVDDGSVVFQVDPAGRGDPWWEEMAKDHWPKKSRTTTLQALAIRAYLAILQHLGIEGLDERSLKRDLQVFRAWEKSTHPDKYLRHKRVMQGWCGEGWRERPVEYSTGWREKLAKRSEAKKPD